MADNEILELSEITVNDYNFKIADNNARSDIDSITAAILANNTSIGTRINNLNDRSFDALIKISSNNDSEISNINDGLYKIKYITITTVNEEEIETLNNSAILIQKNNTQYLYKDGQTKLRIKENDIWGSWTIYGVSSINGQQGAVTINSLPTVTSSDNGKILMVVNGEWQLISPSVLYNGNSVPNDSQGNNGDLYVQTD